MNLSLKQKKDLCSIKFFIPKQLKKIKITDEDIKKFFEFSDRWLHKEDINKDTSWFNCLIQWKRWRGIHIWMYEEGVLDGSVPYSVLLKYMKEPIVEFLSKEMFKWIDRELILKRGRIN